MTGVPDYDGGNIFAKILRGEISCHKVFEDDVALAFMDIAPQVPGHVLVVPKGAKNKAEAMRFLAAATSAEPQAEMASLTSYAPINKASAKLMPAKDAAMLPDQHTAGQINLDMGYWAAHRDEIGKRWYDWQAK